MIDYDSYTKLTDKDLEKIISHVKNIQNQRKTDQRETDFQLLFFNAGIEKITPLLSDINKDLLCNIFYDYKKYFSDSEIHINFYIFLKNNPFTNMFNFHDLDNSLCWKYATPEILEYIK